MDRKTLFYVSLSFRAHYVQFRCAEVRVERPNDAACFFGFFLFGIERCRRWMKEACETCGLCLSQRLMADWRFAWCSFGNVLFVFGVGMNGVSLGEDELSGGMLRCCADVGRGLESDWNGAIGGDGQRAIWEWWNWESLSLQLNGQGWWVVRELVLILMFLFGSYYIAQNKSEINTLCVVIAA